MMQSSDATMDVRHVGPKTFAIDIQGDLTSAGESALTDAYGRASEQGAEAVILNFSGLDYMNSSGIGLLVTLLIRTRRNHQRLLTCGLSDHYKQIFELTRLSDAISIYDSEADALQAAAAGA
jgi:anti-sigma B factor antagonist